MLYTIDKNNLLEEAFRLDSQPKLQKFARRSIKATNNRSTQQFQQDSLLGGAVAPVVGGVIGGVLPSIVNDDADAMDSTIGAEGGVLLGSSLGINAVKSRYSPLAASNTRASKEILTRLQRDGYQPTQNDRNIIDQANAVTRGFNLNNYMRDIALKGRQ